MSLRSAGRGGPVASEQGHVGRFQVWKTTGSSDMGQLGCRSRQDGEMRAPDPSVAAAIVPILIRHRRPTTLSRRSGPISKQPASGPLLRTPARSAGGSMPRAAASSPGWWLSITMRRVRFGSSVPTPTARTSGSSRSRTCRRSGSPSSASRCMAVHSPIPGLIATSGWRAASSSALATVCRSGWSETIGRCFAFHS